MKRLTLPPRPDWQNRLDSINFTWYAATPDHPVPYWEEQAAYTFTPDQITHLHDVSTDLTQRIYHTAERVLSSGDLTALGVPHAFQAAMRDSWHHDAPTVYMRLDLTHTSEGLHLLEINAQTPTSLLEAGVAQWHWLEDHRASGTLSPTTDQYNTIHESLTDQWRHLKERGLTHVHFAATRLDEDLGTVNYLRDLAEQAGINTHGLTTEQLGVKDGHHRYYDTLDLPIDHLMWLHPYEFAWQQPFAHTLTSTRTTLIEPLWKAALASKGFLAELHRDHPDCPAILPASLTPGTLGGQVVLKPLYSREGQNVTLPGQPSTPGEYSGYPLIEQRYVHLDTHDTPGGPRYPVLGLWIAGDTVCGLGIREGRGRVTDNRASFIPHVIQP